MKFKDKCTIAEVVLSYWPVEQGLTLAEITAAAPEAALQLMNEGQIAVTGLNRLRQITGRSLKRPSVWSLTFRQALDDMDRRGVVDAAFRESGGMERYSFSLPASVNSPEQSLSE